MSHHFAGISSYLESSAISRGFDPANASPVTLLYSAAKSNRLMGQVGDAIGQASSAKPEHKAEIVKRAIDILWMIAVMKEAVESALLDFHADHELNIEPLMKVIDHATGHRNSDNDRGIGHDVGATEDRGTEGRPGQPRIDQRRKS